MGQPWGISGPQFLGLYLAGMAATLAVARVLPAANGGVTGILARGQ